MLRVALGPIIIHSVCAVHICTRVVWAYAQFDSTNSTICIVLFQSLFHTEFDSLLLYPDPASKKGTAVRQFLFICLLFSYFSEIGKPVFHAAISASSVPYASCSSSNILIFVSNSSIRSFSAIIPSSFVSTPSNESGTIIGGTSRESG